MSTDGTSTPFKTMIALAGFWLSVAASTLATAAPANDNAPSVTPGNSPTGAPHPND